MDVRTLDKRDVQICIRQGTELFDPSYFQASRFLQEPR